MARVKLFDPFRSLSTNVDAGSVDELLKKGFRREGPSQSQIADITKSAKKGVQKFTDTTGGTTTVKPVADKVKNLQGLLNGQTDKPVAQPVSDVITQQSDESTKSLLAALKQRISESIAGQKQLKEGVSQQFDPLRASSEVSKSQQLRSALERSSVRGDRGGIGRSEALATQTAGENRLTDINIAEQNRVSQIDAEVARLQNEGKFQEAQIVSGQKAQLLQNLLGEQVRQEDITRRETERQEALGTEAIEAKFREELSNITQYSQDYSAEIQRRQGTPDTADDRLIPFLESAKQGKLSDIQTGEAQAGQDAEDRAFKKWNDGIPLNQEEMNLIGSTRSTKPVKPSGGSGTTQVQLFNQADKKVSRGVPLNAAEAAVYGVEPGFVDPNFDGTTSGEDEEPLFSDTDVNFSVGRAVKSATVDEADPALFQELEREAVKTWIVDNADDITGDQGDTLTIRYGLSNTDLDEIKNRLDLQGSQAISPGGQ